MNKKQLIVAWITGIIICLLCLYPLIHDGEVDVIRIVLYIIPVLILGTLLIITLRNDDLFKQIKIIIVKIKIVFVSVKEQIKFDFMKIKGLFKLNSKKIKRIAKRELIIIGIIIGLGISIGLSSRFFPPPPQTFRLYEEFDDLSTGEMEGVSFWLEEVENYRAQHPQLAKLSALDIAGKMAKENPNNQKPYEELKTISEKTIKSGKFDWLSSVAVDKMTFLSKIKDRISVFIEHTFTNEKISGLGVFIIFFGYPFYLIIRFILWVIKTPKPETA